MTLDYDVTHKTRDIRTKARTAAYDSFHLRLEQQASPYPPPPGPTLMGVGQVVVISYYEMIEQSGGRGSTHRHTDTQTHTHTHTHTHTLLCVFRCNLPPALLAEWPRSFPSHCGNTGVERTPNKSRQRKLTLEKKILPPLQPGFELATFRSRVRRSSDWAITIPRI